MAKVCPRCSASNSNQAFHCVNCGESLAGVVATEGVEKAELTALKGRKEGDELDQQVRYRPIDQLEKKVKLLYTLAIWIDLGGAFARFVFLLLFQWAVLAPFWFLMLLLLWFAVIIAPPAGEQDVLRSWGNAYGQIYVLLAFLLAFSNVVLSVLAINKLVPRNMAGNFLTRFSLGARVPSRREREKVVSAFDRIADLAQGEIKAPAYWYVVDKPSLNAFVVGETLYIHRGLINSQYLAAVLVHELGHLNSPDGRLMLAIRRLSIPYVYLEGQTARRGMAGLSAARLGTTVEIPEGSTITVSQGEDMEAVFSLLSILFSVFMSFLSGGLGLVLLGPLWQWHFREREYQADAFVGEMTPELVGELIEVLEKQQFFDTAAPFLLGRSHPYIELRIDRLLRYVE